MVVTEPYKDQVAVWPKEGHHILAQFDDDAVIVYQAYRPSIGRYAAEHGAFGGDFSYSRMSWIKPNFLWMMYRSGWGTRDVSWPTDVLEAAENQTSSPMSPRWSRNTTRPSASR